MSYNPQCHSLNQFNNVGLHKLTDLSWEVSHLHYVASWCLKSLKKSYYICPEHPAQMLVHILGQNSFQSTSDQYHIPSWKLI